MTSVRGLARRTARKMSRPPALGRRTSVTTTSKATAVARLIRGLPVGRFFDGVARGAERVGHGGADVGIVFDEEDFLAHRMLRRVSVAAAERARRGALGASPFGNAVTEW